MALNFPLQNLRQRIDGQWEQLEVNEPITVPSSPDSNGDYIVHLIEVPDNNQVNGNVTITDSSLNVLTQSTTYQPPAGSYYVNYATGRIAFTATHAGQSLSANYFQKGSLVEAEDINYLYEQIEADFTQNYVIQPTTPLSGETFVGKVWFNTVDGLQYVYGSLRDKWISTNRETLVFGRKDPTKNQYLNYFTSAMPCNVSGIRMLRNACITGASVQIQSGPACDFQIRRNNNLTVLDTISIAGGAETGKVVNDLDINVDENDFLQIYLGSDSIVQNPIILIEFAWRK